MAAQTASDLDLFSDEVLLSPYPYYAELRETASVVHLEKTGLWAVTRYAPIREALGDPATFSSKAVAFNDQMNAALVGTSLATDPPDHQALRAALTENLSPRAVRGLKAGIDAKAEAMVADLVERGSFDAMEDLARALPLAVVIDLIGVRDPDVRSRILDWGYAAFNVLGPMNERAIASFPVAGELFEWTHHCKADDLAEGSMGRAIFAAAERGEIAYESCGMIIHQYVAAGMDTTIASIGNAIELFARYPDQFALVREDPSLIPSAFNEVLRYESPLPAIGRLVTRDTEIDGVTIPAGAQAALLMASGNRDPRHFEDPESFRVERNPADHLTFGYGPHGCAGQGLARLESFAVIASLARRLRSYTVGEGTRRINNTTRAYDTLPVLSVDPA
ncbi:cytochrome P450 [Actinocorallia herbida]|uniref:Cytochrome P450 n=1 Tax=Actinocorallia herbida TaxID=58109 RepID=A0A3N1D5W7_9ACTN|nr:cytochrome P450 [Actinocorallia herbida]ROO88927.1 cytochrome P450 [Actinocorallia herbida]